MRDQHLEAVLAAEADESAVERVPAADMRRVSDFDVRVDVDPADPDQVFVSVSPVDTVECPGGTERLTNTSITTDPIPAFAPEPFDGRGGWVSARLILMDSTVPQGVIGAVFESVNRARSGFWVEAAV